MAPRSGTPWTTPRTFLQRQIQNTEPPYFKKPIKRRRKEKILKPRKQTTINIVYATETSSTEDREKPIRQTQQTSVFQPYEAQMRQRLDVRLLASSSMQVLQHRKM